MDERRCDQCGSKFDVIFIPDPECAGVHAWWACAVCRGFEGLPPALRSLPTPYPLTCYDCGLHYGGPGWCDVVLQDEDWLRISPTGHEGGVLCFNCIAIRLHALGMSDVPMLVTSGPFKPFGETLDRAASGRSTDE